MKTENILFGIAAFGLLYYITQKSGLIVNSCQRTYTINGQPYCNSALPFGYYEIKYGNNYFVLPQNKYQEFQQLLAAQQQYAAGQGAGTISALTTFGAFLEQYSPQLLNLVEELNTAAQGNGNIPTTNTNPSPIIVYSANGCPAGKTAVPLFTNPPSWKCA
jgi:hypothetical protein